METENTVIDEVKRVEGDFHRKIMLRNPWNDKPIHRKVKWIKGKPWVSFMYNKQQVIGIEYREELYTVFTIRG